ncbi:MAG: carbohydrate kinase family protein [Nakamurella sp.]
MRFPGNFTDSLLADQLDRVSLSFLVDDLVVRRGGVAANIAFTMGVLGARTVLVDAVGHDFSDYDSWLTRHGVDTSHILRCSDVATARFVCTTDEAMNQIGSFYAGAMARSREIELAPVIEAIGGVDLVMISAGDPDGMARHAAECRANGWTFAADPSQQLARITGEQARELVLGAEMLFSNDYELGLIQAKTGWSAADIAEKVHTRITTHGADGVEITSAGVDPLHVPVVPEHGKIDPTGVGDAFRGGFLAGRTADLPVQRCAELGALMATLVLETVGTQEYEFDIPAATDRLAGAYGDDAAREIGTALGW